MKGSAAARAVVDAALLVCVVFGWWYAALPLGILAAFAFPFYAEILIAGLAFDSLFGMMPGSGVAGYSGTIAAVAAFTVAALIRLKIR